MKNNNDYNLVPGFRNSFGTGWKVMQDNFLRLFLVVLILSILTAPMKAFEYKFDKNDLDNISLGFGQETGESLQTLFTIGALGAMAAFFVLLAMLYFFLVSPVFIYGGDFIFVQSVRKNKPEFEYLVKGFTDNYFNIVLAHLLVSALTVLGFFALIIPGIIIACRLVFVSYIVMDKKLDPIEAVELSWKLTRGHGWRIFLMGVASIFIIIFGLMLMIVGIFPAMIWVGSSFASLYESILREKEPALISSPVI